MGEGDLDDGEHLAGGGDERAIRRSADFESAPETQAFDALQPAVHDEVVTQAGRALAVDPRPHHDGIVLGLAMATSPIPSRSARSFRATSMKRS
jgi:hypothetical protein